MGSLANTMNKIQLNCLLHGDYQRLTTDSVKACPQCLEESGKQAERLAEKHEVEKISLSKTVSLVEKTIQCEIHEAVTFQVPSFMANSDLLCPTCIQEKRNEELRPQIQEMIGQELKKTGIPVNYVGMQFSTLDFSRSNKQQPIVQRLIKYVQDLKAAGASDGAKNILLHGNMGTGKTLYAAILLQEVLKRSLANGVVDPNDIRLKGGLSVLFVSEPALLHEITATWKADGGSQKALLKRLAKKSILCIDDVGTITSTNTHLLDFYAALIDERYKRRLPTIITSNLRHDDLKLAIGARAADRFFEKNRVIVMGFDWNSYRGGQTGTDEIEMF